MTVLHLGTVAHLKADPFRDPAGALEIVESGALLVDAQGRIVRVGTRRELAASAPEAEIVEHGAAWLLPGSIDGHVHFPQYAATAAYGRHLLDWLERSILPAETAYADAELAERTARRFVRRLLACGTTTALVFGSQFRHANLSLFDAAADAGLRLIAGATLMDRGGPASLLQTVAQARDHAEELIARCRGERLSHYAVTPRYALSCSAGMMDLCADLLRRHPEIYVQTHINESLGEIEAVMAHYADCRDYLEVYERFGLVTDRTVLAHDIHVSDAQLQRLARAGCAVCHCPSSNLYLGSGLFPLMRHIEHGVRVCMGTDIGAGTRFSVWENLSDAYKIQQLQGHTLNAAQLLYLGTLGGAEALRLAHETGNFEAGKSADFLVLRPEANAWLGERLERCAQPEDRLFCLLHLATEREIAATYVAGRQVYRQAA